MGYLGTYPEPVWYNPGGVANILSQNNVAQHFQLTMDTQVENSISLHWVNGNLNHLYSLQHTMDYIATLCLMRKQSTVFGP